MSNIFSRVCYKCKCIPQGMNKIEKFRIKRMHKTFFINLNFQHFILRSKFFECLLHITYWLEFIHWHLCKTIYSFRYSSDTDNNDTYFIFGYNEIQFSKRKKRLPRSFTISNSFTGWYCSTGYVVKNQNYFSKLYLMCV